MSGLTSQPRGTCPVLRHREPRGMMTSSIFFKLKNTFGAVPTSTGMALCHYYKRWSAHCPDPRHF